MYASDTMRMREARGTGRDEISTNRMVSFVVSYIFTMHGDMNK